MSSAPLATYRRQQGLSQEQLSTLSGVSARTIQRIEKGTVEAHGATLKLLADALAIDAQLLLSEVPPATVPTVTKPAAKLTPLFHALALLGLLFPVLNIVLPAALWFLKKEEHPEYEQEGKLVINFQLTMSFAFVPAVFLLVYYFPLGFPLTLLIYFYTVVMCLINLFRAINQQRVRYPLSYAFLK